MQQLFIDLLFAAATGVIVWAVRTVVLVVVPYVTTKLSQTKYSWASEIIEYAVRAFEQTVSGSGRGEEKFELVMDLVNRELSKLGIKLSEDQITILIEASVQAMNSEQLIFEEAAAVIEDSEEDEEIAELVPTEDLSGEDVDKLRPRPRKKRVTHSGYGVQLR